MRIQGNNLLRAYVEHQLMQLINDLGDDSYEDAFFRFYEDCIALERKTRKLFSNEEKEIEARVAKGEDSERVFPLGKEFDSLEEKRMDSWFPAFKKLRDKFIKRLKKDAFYEW